MAVCMSVEEYWNTEVSVYHYRVNVIFKTEVLHKKKLLSNIIRCNLLTDV